MGLIIELFTVRLVYEIITWNQIIKQKYQQDNDLKWY